MISLSNGTDYAYSTQVRNFGKFYLKKGNKNIRLYFKILTNCYDGKKNAKSRNIKFKSICA
jgi:hypothetical protein